MPAKRSLDIPSLSGFLLASLGARTFAIEVMVRGWWGFATTWVNLIVVLAWLGLSGWLCVGAFESADGWWQVLAFAGIVVSVAALAVLLVVEAHRFLLEHPDALIDDSNRQRKRTRSNRGRRRLPW